MGCPPQRRRGYVPPRRRFQPPSERTFIADTLIAYRFSVDRSGETPKEVLGGTKGTLVVDAYTGYDRVTQPDGRRRAGCLARARRKLFAAMEGEPEAREALDMIRDGYLVEHAAKERDITATPAHRALRQADKPRVHRSCTS